MQLPYQVVFHTHTYKGAYVSFINNSIEKNHYLIAKNLHYNLSYRRRDMKKSQQYRHKGISISFRKVKHNLEKQRQWVYKY